jgi:hypothetical protein
MLADRILTLLKALAQHGKAGLAFAGGPAGGVQRGLDVGYVLDLLPDFLLQRLDGGESAVDAAGQAFELLLRAPPFFASTFRCKEARTSRKASAIRKPGGFRGPP